jgi:hypothetical protein
LLAYRENVNYLLPFLGYEDGKGNRGYRQQGWENNMQGSREGVGGMKGIDEWKGGCEGI